MGKSAIQELAKGRSDLFRLDPRDIVVAEGWNARNFEDPENKAHIEDLKISIKSVGVLEPLTIHLEDGKPVLTNGECRLRAVLALIENGVEIKTVPCQTEPRQASEADRLASQIVRNSGRPFTVLEQAKVFYRLAAFGWSNADIAARASLTPERVAQIILLNQAPAQTQKMIQTGKVSATTVQKVIQRASKDGSVRAADINNAVRAAVDKAEAEGKGKASARHVEPKARPAPKPRTDFKTLLQEIFSYVQTAEQDGDNQVLTLVMTNDRYQEIHGLAQ